MKTLPDKLITDAKNFTDEEFNVCLNKWTDEAKNKTIINIYPIK